MSSRVRSMGNAFLVLILILTGVAMGLLLLQVGFPIGVAATFGAGGVLTVLLLWAVVDAVGQSRRINPTPPHKASLKRRPPRRPGPEPEVSAPVLMEDDAGVILSMEPRGRRPAAASMDEREPRTRWVPLVEKPSGRPRRTLGTVAGVALLALGAWLLLTFAGSERWDGYVYPAEGMFANAAEAAATRLGIGSYPSRKDCYDALNDLADSQGYESDSFVLRCERTRRVLPF